MKKQFFLLVLLVANLFPLFYLIGQDDEEILKRNSTSVKDVTQPYSPEEMIIAESEEQQNDQQVSNAPECDIRAIMSCYDKESLRFDIVLWNPIQYKFKTWFGIRIEYKDSAEYYIYFPATKQLEYLLEENDEITKDEILKQDDEDFAVVTSYNDVKGTSVAIVISKKKHIGGTVGKKYYITCDFESGFIDKEGKIQRADYTKTVDVYFVK